MLPSALALALFALRAHGELDALAVVDGAVLWARHLDGVIRGIGYEDDLLFVGTLKGALFAVRPPRGGR